MIGDVRDRAHSFPRPFQEYLALVMVGLVHVVGMRALVLELNLELHALVLLGVEGHRAPLPSLGPM